MLGILRIFISFLQLPVERKTVSIFHLHLNVTRQTCTDLFVVDHITFCACQVGLLLTKHMLIWHKFKNKKMHI